MDQDKKITVLFIIKPERGAGAEMVLVEAAARLNPDRFRVICGLLTPDAEKVIPAHLPTVDFRMPGLNGWVWLPFLLAALLGHLSPPGRSAARQQLCPGELCPPGRGADAGAHRHRPLARLHPVQPQAPAHLPGPGAVYRPESGGLPGGAGLSRSAESVWIRPKSGWWPTGWMSPPLTRPAPVTRCAGNWGCPKVCR